jgi:hypothetical protein
MNQCMFNRHQCESVIISYFRFFRQFVYVQQQVKRILFLLLYCFFSSFEGLIALAYSVKSSAKADVNFHDKARLYSRRALCWNIISVVLVIFSFIMVFVNYVLCIEYSLFLFRLVSSFIPSMK